MTDMNTSIEEKRMRAKQRIEELKGFYIHLVVYVLVNLFITVSKLVANFNNGENFGEAFWDFGTFAVWIFWGIGLMFHAIKVFSLNPFFGRDWEERQIQKYMEEDKRESQRYR